MTRLLEKAFENASKLPQTEQNALARWLLEEIGAERKWDQTFAESEDVLGRLADEAVRARRQRKTRPLDIHRL